MASSVDLTVRLPSVFVNNYEICDVVGPAGANELIKLVVTSVQSLRIGY